MAAASRRRLGKGLSEMFAQPVAVDVPEAGETASSETPPQFAERAPDHEAAAATAPPKNGDEVATTEASPPTESQATGGGVGVRFVSIDQLAPNPYQPRQQAHDAGIDTLADSIRIHGLMQPVVVRPQPESGTTTGRDGESSPGTTFEIIAGERRWRAARMAGLERIPAVVRALDDRDAAEWALVENLQREDLNPIDRAHAFAGLVERFGLSHDDVAQRVGVDRSTVANLIRLLSLAPPVQDLVRHGRLSMGHARAIAGLSDADAQAAAADRAVRQSLSVRQVERLVKSLASAGPTPPSEAPSRPAAPARGTHHLEDLEHRIGEQLGTRVAIRPGRKKGTGRLTIEFHSLDAFDDLLARLGVEAG